MKLNQEQADAVATEGHVMVIATAGSGKTAMTIAKVAHILRSDPLARVCLVVFNAAAGQEIRERLKKRNVPTERIITGTYHSLALRQLKSSGKPVNLAVGAGLYQVYSEAWDMAGHPCEYHDIGTTIDQYKTDMRAHTGPAEFKSDHIDEPGFTLYEAYQDLLHRYRLTDFTDLLVQSVLGMATGTIKPLPMTHLLADEFQDTDPIQMTWLHLHASLTGATMTVVGDDDQTIYEFRHALGYSGFVGFEETYKARRITLGRNYRSRSEILDPANTLIHRNDQRLAKTLVSERGEGGEVTIAPCLRGELEECKAIVEWLNSNPDSERAILARTNRALDTLAMFLKESAIPFLRMGGESFWDLPPIQLLLTSLDYLTGYSRRPLAKNQIMDALGGPGGDDGNVATSVQLEAFEQLAAHGKRVEGQTGDGLSNFIETVHTFLLRNVLWELPMYRAVSYKVMAPAVKSLTKAKGSWPQRRTSTQLKSTPPATLPRLLTFHGSKGLEFQNVWILGAQEGKIPPTSSDTGRDALEQERRLFFVAMTRAKDTLVISHYGTPCLFVDELQIFEEEEAHVEEI